VFCRSCYYDLRGQNEPRCPECSRAFQFDVPESWLAEIPTIAGGVVLFAWTLILTLVRLILIFLMIASYFAIPDLEGCTRYPTMGITAENLRVILEEWKRQCGDNKIDCEFNKESAGANLGRRISPARDVDDLRNQRLLQRHLETGAAKLVGPCFFAFLLVATFRGSLRKGMLWLTGSGLCLSVLGCALSTPIASLRYQGSHAFLDDYRFLVPPFATLKTDGYEYVVVAVEEGSIWQGKKYVGLVGGEIFPISESQAEELFRTVP
jgi:hypothetical protein